LGVAQVRLRVLGHALLALLATAGCGGGSDEPAERPGVRGALGGDAKVRTLARARLDRPRGELAWVTHEVRLRSGEGLRHRHEPAFVLTREGAQVLRVKGPAATLGEGEAKFVSAGQLHVHSGAGKAVTIWETRLAAPETRAPRGARRVFASEPLEGIPRRSLASLLVVRVPPRGGRTTVHTHPGPELIFQTKGRIDYENAIVGTKRLGPGDAEAIPPGTPVQKRNPLSKPATFLSWFLVDPAKPFAPQARFKR